jgi:general secretion pathway protein G
VPNVLDRADDARVTAARTDVQHLVQALSSCTSSTTSAIRAGEQVCRRWSRSRPPVDTTELEAYLDKLPNDPWGRPYQYANPGLKGEIDVYSFGADGVLGGEGNNAEMGLAVTTT